MGTPFMGCGLLLVKPHPMDLEVFRLTGPIWASSNQDVHYNLIENFTGCFQHERKPEKAKENMKHLIFFLSVPWKFLLAFIQCWQNPAISQRKRIDLPCAVSVVSAKKKTQQNTKPLSECISWLLGDAKYAMGAGQAWLGTENWPYLLCFWAT